MDNKVIFDNKLRNDSDGNVIYEEGEDERIDRIFNKNININMNEFVNEGRVSHLGERNTIFEMDFYVNSVINFSKNISNEHLLNYYKIINGIKNEIDRKDKLIINEYKCNLLILSSKISLGNKVQCLSLLSFINYENGNTPLIYYTNKKILKALESKNDIDLFICIRSLFRTGEYLNKQNNFFYSYKYLKKAIKLSYEVEINKKPKEMLMKLYQEVTENIRKYNSTSSEKFKNDKDITNEKLIRINNLLDEVFSNKYITEGDINDFYGEGGEYLYLISNKWLQRAKLFIECFIGNKSQDIFVADSFNINFVLYSFLGFTEKLKNKKFNCSPYPGPIDNYCISEFKDYWKDNLDEDDNYYIKPNLKYQKDYYLLYKKDWDFLDNIFGSTNIIKRKKVKNCLNLISFKTIIFDKRFIENKNLLKPKNLQIIKLNTVGQLKQKIIRCVEKSINENKNVVLKVQDIKEVKHGEKNENLENDEAPVPNMNINVEFYLIPIEKKEILIEMIIGYTHSLQKFDYLYLSKLNINENVTIEELNKLYKIYEKKKFYLVAEVTSDDYNQDLFPYLNEIKLNEEENCFHCSVCNKQIKALNNTYQCNICNLSLFCSEECALKSKDHKKLHQCFEEKILKKFNFNDFIKEGLKMKFKKESLKGLVCLNNLGNTCYINSILQCLSHTYLLRNYFLNNIFVSDISIGNKNDFNGSLSRLFFSLLCNLWYGHNSIFTPLDFLKKCESVFKTFKINEQQDCQEFLTLFLEHLNKDLNRVKKLEHINNPITSAEEDDLIASQKWWEVHKKREDSIIVDLFHGQLKSIITCLQCNKSSLTFEPFMSLSLPIPQLHTQHYFKFILGNRKHQYIHCSLQNNSTIANLRSKGLDFLKKYNMRLNNIDVSINDIMYNRDIDIFQLDSDKKIVEIYNFDDRKSNINNPLQNIIKNNNELILYEKINDKNCISIYIIPSKIVNNSFGRSSKGNKGILKILQNPWIFTFPLNLTLEKVQCVVENGFSNIISRDASFYNDDLDKEEIITLSFYRHGITGKASYPSIFSTLKKENTIKNLLEKNNNNNIIIKNALILLALSDNYDLIKIENLNNGDNNVIDNYSFYGDYINISQINNLDNDNDNDNEPRKNIYDALDLFIKEEKMEGSNSIFCDNCKINQPSSKKLLIFKTPIYLIIHLKRFDYININEKDNTFIDYPIEDLDLSDFVVGKDKKNSLYNLYGVIIHKGQLQNGHYTAICKNQNKWIYFNDDTLSEIDSPLSKDAYLLFYVKKDIS